MSLNGWRQVELAQERRRQIRLEQVRTNVEALIQRIQRQIQDVKDPAVQQLAGSELSKINAQVPEIQRRLAQDPDRALTAARSTQKQLQRTLSDARAGAKKWSQEQARANARIEELRARLETEDGSTSSADSQTRRRAEEAVCWAVNHAAGGRGGRGLQRGRISAGAGLP